MEIKNGVATFAPGELEKLSAEDRNWGEVELFRWQYGELPKPDDKRPLIYSEALIKAGKAVREMQVSPFNASEMLKVAGLLLKDLGK